MTAEEMFKNIGFKKVHDNLAFVTYMQNDECFIKKIFHFLKDEKDIIMEYEKGLKGVSFIECELSFKELQAINKQVEELGW